jgi:HEAT repeat protein
MELKQLIEIVDTMAIEHAYPGFDIRGHVFGLPSQVSSAHAGVFIAALSQDNVLVKLVALRWLQERSGDAKRHLDAVSACLDDADFWVRLEAAKTISKVDKVTPDLANQVAKLLNDQSVEVRRETAKVLSKLGITSEPVLSALKSAAENDVDAEVRWKSQKALRRLGAYS